MVARGRLQSRLKFILSFTGATCRRGKCSRFQETDAGLDFVKIRLIGDKESVYLAAMRLALRLKWKEYPLFLDKDRTKIDEEGIALYAIIATRPSVERNAKLDCYIDLEKSLQDLRA